MKVLSWNIRHGGGARATAIAERLVSQNPDVVVLTEFRNNEAGEKIQSTLVAAGLCHVASPNSPPRKNSVLIASRHGFEADPIPGLGDQSHRGLWARFPGFNLLGFYFPNKEEKRPVFEAVCELDIGLLRERSLLIGDFNTGRHYVDEPAATFIASEYFDRFEDIGWVDAWRSRHPDAREFSWFSSVGNGFRIDHAFASPSLNSQISEIAYSHAERTEGLSDHSALLLRIALDRSAD